MSGELGIGFDFDRTLGTDGSLEVLAFYRLAEARGVSLDRKDGSWAERVHELLRVFRSGAVGLDDMVQRFIAALGVDAQRADGDRWRAICFALIDELVAPLDGARELIAALDAHGVPHAILTNGWSPLQERKIARALDYRGPILVSDVIGILKPDAAAFGKLIDTLALPRDVIWYVGDNPMTDILGATNAGLRSVWFNADNIGYPASAPPPTVQVTRVIDVLDAVRGAAPSAQNIRA